MRFVTFRDRLIACLRDYRPARRAIPDWAEAAVLVPVVERAGGPALVFTQRPAHMPTHGGQISFPGGRRDAGDADLVATALREAAEEIGVAPRAVEVVGQLDDEITPHRFVITPIVGWLGDPPPFRPSAREVEQCFELPIATLADPAAFVDRGEREFGGRVYSLPEYHVDERIIWGVTARMVQRLLALLAG